MKKIYTVFALSTCFLFYNAQAQSGLNLTGYTAIPVNHIHATINKNPSPLTTDTLAPPSFGMPFQCDTAPSLYQWQAPTSGYIYGNNSIPESECAEKYYATGSVSEVLVWIGYTKGTGNVSSNIYSISATTQGPSTVLGTSAAVAQSGISTSAFTSFMFTPAVAVTNSFAASVLFPAITGDTVAVVSNQIGCSTPDSLSWVNLPSNGGWLATTQVVSGNPNTDLWIFPVGTLTNTTGINEYAANGLHLLGAYPNPATDFTNIRYRLDDASTVSIAVFDITGRIIHNSSENLSAGTHDINVSLKNVPAGNYYYTVKTNMSVLTSKFIVTK